MPRKSAAPKQPKTNIPETTPHIINWDGVEIQYRCGIRSLKDIGKEFGVSDAGIIKKAKKEGWTRDLTARINAKADAKVSAAAVSKIVSVEKAANEQTIVEANAEIQYRIRMSHRKGLSKLCAVKETLLAHIESVAVNLDDLGDIVEMMRNPDDKGQDKANDRLRKAMERSTVIDDLKKLAEIDEKIRKGEREAFSITDAPGSDTPEDAFGKFLSALSARGSRLPMGSGQ